jgi:hypothetical protein
MQMALPMNLFGQSIDPKSAAAKVKDGDLFAGPRFELFDYPVEPLLALFLDFEQPSFFHYPEMLRNIVLGNLEASSDLVHAQRLFQQKPQDAKPGFLTQGSQRDDAR